MTQRLAGTGGVIISARRGDRVRGRDEGKGVDGRRWKMNIEEGTGHKMREEGE